MAHSISMPTPGLVQRLERIGSEDRGLLLVQVLGQEAAGVVARQSHGRLRQVVGAEAEELG